MQEICGLDIHKLRINVYLPQKMEQLRAACLMYYKTKYIYDPSTTPSHEVIQHMRMHEFCIFYGNDDSASTLLAQLLICLPPDSELFKLINIDKIIAKIKQNLSRYGYTETTFAEASLKDRVEVINDLIPKLCIDCDWRRTVEKVRTILIEIHLTLISLHFDSIIEMNLGKDLPEKDPLLPYLYCLHLIEYLNIALYLTYNNRGFADPYFHMRKQLESNINSLLEKLREFDPEKKPSFAGLLFSGFSSCYSAPMPVVAPSRKHPRFQVYY